MPDDADPTTAFLRATDESRALRRRLMTQSDEPGFFVNFGLIAFGFIILISALAAIGHFTQVTP
ncbi:MAG: hypothetical protein UX09_C0030G0001 [Candidatus Uhrbacteria bacterium GW2011_GWE2_45_35]|uniref:Uncharacterized protein n=1 Tax=Candidatus Uhrbacteria bacterium GW2011_GWE2_45_35 TaxID=1618993 RepID=A0A0G1MH65_9BACT|nr:MAG: hypothetical protein UX09_C0030G0001 [Candidatus Uhrbacteria bacterium GW2011_GWE2_45_35]